MLTEDYAVRLQNFEGPLDLLLHLVTRAEVDVTEVSLASITDQYLDHLSRLAIIDVDPASEFLVMAATLIELKSRTIAPPAEDAGTADDAALAPRDAENPARDLVRQLLQYKRFREAALRLEERRATWDRRFPLGKLMAPTIPAVEGEDPPIDLEDVSLFDLVQAYGRIAQTVVFERIGDHKVVDEETPIELHAADILDRLRNAPVIAEAQGADPRPTMPLRTIFYGRRRSEIIGLFLAVLELVRQRAVRVVQKAEEPEPTISLGEAQPDPGADPGVSANGSA